MAKKKESKPRPPARYAAGAQVRCLDEFAPLGKVQFNFDFTFQEDVIANG